MASQACWRCLARPLQNANSSTPSFRCLAVLQPTSHAFSTSTSRSSKASKQRKERLLLKKEKGKPPAPGERKAIRKTIVLSNTNALAIPTLQEMTAENTSDPSYRGVVLSLPDKLVSRLRAAECFQTKQRWRLFRRVSVVLRSANIRLAQMMDDAKVNKRVVRQVVVGDRGAGKSLYLLQAVTSAMFKDWIVITIPEGQDLVNASTDYGPMPVIRPIMYQQKAYMAALLQRIVTTNPQLAELEITLNHQMAIPIPAGISLSKLAALGISDMAVAQPIFEALMKELTATGRPPLLITLDGFNHINSLTAYRSASFQPIHAHDFYLPSWFTAHLSGKNSLPNGGAVLAVITCSNNPRIKTLDDRLTQLEKQQSLLNGDIQLDPKDNLSLPYLLATGQEHLATQVPDLDPYVRYDTRVLEVFSHTKSPAINNPAESSSSEVDSKPKDSKSNASWSSLTPADSTIEVKRIHGLTKLEAKRLMEYWALSGMLRAEISERFVGEQWSVAGGGLPGELERTCLGMRF